MLNDRDYMRRPSGAIDMGARLRRMSETGRLCVWMLIALNVAIYIFIPKAGFYDPAGLYEDLVLRIPEFRDGAWWTLATAMFLHGDFWHLALNMYGLFIFGSLVAPNLGAGRFLIMYFAGGIAGNLLYMAFFWNSPYGLVGASGALFGVMLSAALLMPHLRFVLLFPPVPLRVTTLVVVYAIIELASQLAIPRSGIAHLAHLGGFIGGYIAMKIMFGNRLAWDPLRFLKLAGPRPTFYRPPADNDDPRNYRNAGESPRNAEDDGSPVSSREIDALLDKISRGGVNSLTPREQARLRRAREEMRRR